MTVDFPRLNYLRKRVESGKATFEEQREWLRGEIAEDHEGLRKSEAEIGSALERHAAQAAGDLRQRVRDLAGGELIEAGRRLWADFRNQWGEEAARHAWEVVQPKRRHGRTEWKSIPPPRTRGFHTSDLAHFQRFSQANRAGLLATQPTQKGGTLSKEKAARAVRADGTVDPARHFRRIKARPPIRD